MNELINKLADQACNDLGQSTKWEFMNEIDKDIFERFAELIVQECMGRCSVNEHSPSYEARARIAEHFGVE
jgi:hypothetical protein